VRIAATVLTASLVASLAVTTATTAGAVAAPRGTALTAVDKPGDVKIYAGRQGATTKVRTSIDLRRVAVRTRGARTTFTVRIKDVLPASAASTQVVYLSIAPDASSGQRWAFDLGMTPQQPGEGYANYVQDATDASTSPGDQLCESLRVTTPGRGLVRMAVPRRCLPADPGVLGITTLIGGYRNGEQALSLDTLVVPVVRALR
jgi:hypothetical protein